MVRHFPKLGHSKPNKNVLQFDEDGTLQKEATHLPPFLMQPQRVRPMSFSSSSSSGIQENSFLRQARPLSSSFLAVARHVINVVSIFVINACSVRPFTGLPPFTSTNLDNFSERFENRPQRAIGSLPGKTTHEDLPVHLNIVRYAVRNEHVHAFDFKQVSRTRVSSLCICYDTMCISRTVPNLSIRYRHLHHNR